MSKLEIHAVDTGSNHFSYRTPASACSSFSKNCNNRGASFVDMHECFIKIGEGVVSVKNKRATTRINKNKGGRKWRFQ